MSAQGNALGGMVVTICGALKGRHKRSQGVALG
jgi:hypothetical protein